MTGAPCTDVELEGLYIRSCFGVKRARQYAHLADASLRLAVEDVFADVNRKILGEFYALVDSKRHIEPSHFRALDRAVFEKFEWITRYDGGPQEEPPDTLATQLREMARRRRKYVALQRACAALVEGHEEAADEHVLSVSTEQTESRAFEFLTLADCASIAVAEAQQSRKETTTQRTGFHCIDKAIGNLRAKTMSTIGGTTGSGKSSIMLAMAVNQARRGLKVGIVSCEDAESVWGERGLAIASGLNPDDLRENPENHKREVERGHAELRALGVTIAYELNRPVADVLRAVRHLARKFGCKIIYVDYLQAILDANQNKDRRNFVANTAARLKAQCQELGVALVLGSQVSRPAKEKPFGEVFTSDLKESGDIENMSEVVMLLWKNGDKDTSVTLGKVAKVKWSRARPRFQVERDTSGSVVGLVYQNQGHQSAGGGDV